MATSRAFDWVCDELEAKTSLDRLEARGTVRIALKSGGLEARSVTGLQMKVVVERLLPAELHARGVENEADLCSELVAGLARADLESASPGDAPDEVFRRLGG